MWPRFSVFSRRRLVLTGESKVCPRGPNGISRCWHPLGIILYPVGLIFLILIIWLVSIHCDLVVYWIVSFLLGESSRPFLTTVSPLSNRRYPLFSPCPGVHILGGPWPISVSEYVQYLSYSGVIHHRRQYTHNIILFLWRFWFFQE